MRTLERRAGALRDACGRAVAWLTGRPDVLSRGGGTWLLVSGYMWAGRGKLFVTGITQGAFGQSLRGAA